MTVVALAAACSSSTSAAGGIAAYAAGDWECALFSDASETSLTTIGARVTVRDDITGRVTIDVPAPDGTRSTSGTWMLADDRLTVRWDPSDMPPEDNLGPTHGRGVALDADRIEIRGEGTRPHRVGDWVPVTVDRRARAVTFGFPVGAGSERGRLRCVKA
jgi:hypothetical protein